MWVSLQDTFFQDSTSESTFEVLIYGSGLAYYSSCILKNFYRSKQNFEKIRKQHGDCKAGWEKLDIGAWKLIAKF